MSTTISKLDVVNGCLKTMGEAPLNALDNDHPFVQAALLTLSNAMTLEQGRGWWFNTDLITSKPDAITGFVYVPADALSFDSAYKQLVQRGRRLYDRYNQTYDLREYVEVTASVIRSIPFEDMPPMAQQLIAARTWLDFQASYDADSMRYQELATAYKTVNANMKAQHIRNSNINLFNAAGVADKMRRIRPAGTHGVILNRYGA